MQMHLLCARMGPTFRRRRRPYNAIVCRVESFRFRFRYQEDKQRCYRKFISGIFPSLLPLSIISFPLPSPFSSLSPASKWPLKKLGDLGNAVSSFSGGRTFAPTRHVPCALNTPKNVFLAEQGSGNNYKTWNTHMRIESNRST